MAEFRPVTIALDNTIYSGLDAIARHRLQSLEQLIQDLIITYAADQGINPEVDGPVELGLD